MSSSASIPAGLPALLGWDFGLTTTSMAVQVSIVPVKNDERHSAMMAED
jgi:hypothetical protein